MLGPRNIKKLWSNTRRVNERNKLRTALIPSVQRELGKSHPEIVDIPVLAAHAAVRQSGRVLELQNRDLWTRSTDQPWHFSFFFLTICELPFKTSVGRVNSEVGRKEAEDSEK